MLILSLPSLPARGIAYALAGDQLATLNHWSDSKNKPKVQRLERLSWPVCCTKLFHCLFARAMNHMSRFAKVLVCSSFYGSVSNVTPRREVNDTQGQGFVRRSVNPREANPDTAHKSNSKRGWTTQKSESGVFFPERVKKKNNTPIVI